MPQPAARRLEPADQYGLLARHLAQVEAVMSTPLALGNAAHLLIDGPPTQRAMLHAKTAVIDGVWSSVGSTNLDWRSSVHNYEADLLVLDSRFAGEMEQLFGLDQSASREIGESEWAARGIGARFLEWLAQRWDYWL